MVMCVVGRYSTIGSGSACKLSHRAVSLRPHSSNVRVHPDSTHLWGLVSVQDVSGGEAQAGFGAWASTAGSG